MTLLLQGTYWQSQGKFLLLLLMGVGLTVG